MHILPLCVPSLHRTHIDISLQSLISSPTRLLPFHSSDLQAPPSSFLPRTSQAAHDSPQAPQTSSKAPEVAFALLEYNAVSLDSAAVFVSMGFSAEGKVLSVYRLMDAVVKWTLKMHRHVCFIAIGGSGRLLVCVACKMLCDRRLRRFSCTGTSGAMQTSVPILCSCSRIKPYCGRV